MYGQVIYNKGGAAEKWENWFWDNYISIGDIRDLRVKNDFLKYQDQQPKMKRQIRLIKTYHYEWKGKPQNGRRYLPHLKLVKDS